MKGRFHVPLRVAAVSGSMALVAMMAAAPAVAAEGDVDVVNTETVSIYTDPTGEVDKKRIYEQISATGEGTVEIRNPAQTEGMRNLDGFGGFDTEDGQQVATLEVDGKERLRTVSEYDGDLPLDIQVQYYLDGELIDPEDVVGKSGHLEVKYRVKNVTAAPQELTYDDGTGNMVTETVEVPIPMVGSLTLVAPSNFTEVTSGEANLAGDGKGGTKLSFTMTLFPPIGSDTAEFGYEAEISDGVIPRATVTALPVNPLESPSFKAAGESYKGGAETGIELTDGASQIDANLLKLRDGAGELLAGLIQLRDGAKQLEAGLAGEAAPGANKLAAGASELSGGLGQIDDGAGQLAAGAGEAAAGGSRLADGARQLDDGAGQLRDGAGRLAGGLGEARQGTKKLSGGLGELNEGAAALSEGFNSTTGEPDLVTGIRSLRDGLELIKGGVDQLADGLPAANEALVGLRGGVDRLLVAMDNPDCDPTGKDPARPCGLLQGVQGLQAELSALDAEALVGGLEMLSGAIDHADLKAKQGLGALAGTQPARTNIADRVATLRSTLGCEADPTIAGCDSLDAIQANLEVVNGGVGTAQTSLMSAVGSEGTGLAKVVVGQLRDQTATLPAKLARADAVLTAMETGIGKVKLGLSNTNCEIDNPRDPLNPCGMAQVLDELILKLGAAAAGVTGDGLPEDQKSLLQGVNEAFAGAQILATKIAEAGAGAGLIAGGLNDASTGSQDLLAGMRLLSNGAGDLAAGSGELESGTGQLASGAGELSAGLGALSAGAGQLADGTGKAADGSTQLADGANQLATGLGEAASGSGRLADGLKQASKGAPKLVDGAQRLSDEGTSKLVEAGEATAQNYGQMYASLEAGAERAQTEKMVFGAPEGAMGLAAYSYEIGGEDGESGRNLARGLGGAAVLAAGAGAFALRRRFI